MTACPACGRSCGCAPALRAFTLTTIDLEKWSEEFATIIVVDPWERLRDSLATLAREFVASVVYEAIQPPANWRWYQGAAHLSRPSAATCRAYRARPWRHQARACRIDARRWKRRRFIHTLRSAAA